jgi:hypothetical protein
LHFKLEFAVVFITGDDSVSVHNVSAYSDGTRILSVRLDEPDGKVTSIALWPQAGPSAGRVCLLDWGFDGEFREMATSLPGFEVERWAGNREHADE